ncbi:MAG: hypothetical protein ABIR30_03340 [Chitinophagaceae bacterium]
MKRILSERNLVVVLFVMVLITFSLAQEDSKKMERMYSGAYNSGVSHTLLVQKESNNADRTGHADLFPITTAE